MLHEYNAHPGNNPLGLYRAYQLYENRTYGQLVGAFGMENVYILSAGWGLISGAFLTPYYDITFSPSAEGYKRRRKADQYRDICLLPDSEGEIVFLGGRDYLPLFCALTSGIRPLMNSIFEDAWKQLRVQSFASSGPTMVFPR